MRDLVQYLAKSLVSKPDAVEVKETEGDNGVYPGVESGQGRPRTNHRQARPDGEINSYDPECRGFENQS